MSEAIAKKTAATFTTPPNQLYFREEVNEFLLYYKCGFDRPFRLRKTEDTYSDCPNIGSKNQCITDSKRKGKIVKDSLLVFRPAAEMTAFFIKNFSLPIQLFEQNSKIDLANKRSGERFGLNIKKQDTHLVCDVHSQCTIDGKSSTVLCEPLVVTEVIGMRD